MSTDDVVGVVSPGAPVESLCTLSKSTELRLSVSGGSRCEEPWLDALLGRPEEASILI